MKKCLALLLSLAICMSFTVPVFAEETTPKVDSGHLYPLSSEDIAEVSNMASGFLEYAPEYTGADFKVGTYIPTYTWDGDQLVEDDSARRYPVYADRKIVSFYTIIDPESGDSARQFGAEFSSQLNTVLNTKGNEYSLVGYEGKTYVITGEEVTLLASYEFPAIDLDDIQERIDAQENSTRKQDYEEFYTMVQGKQAAAGTTQTTSTRRLTVDSLEAGIRSSSADLLVNSDLNHIDSLQSIIPGRLRAGDYRYFSVAKYNQLPDQNICWAVAATRIGNFWNSTNTTPTAAVQHIFGVNSRKGNILDAQDVLSEMYELSSSYTTYGYTWDEVADCIEGGTLLYGAFYDDAWTKGHAVCVNGYYINGSEGLLIMESLGGTYKQLLANSSGLYLMNYTGLGNLSWQSALTVPG